MDDYLNYLHRNFIQQLIETDAEIHREALNRAPRVQSNRAKHERISQGGKTIMGIITKTELMGVHRL